MSKRWKKGRGKLGPFEPLFGSWVADTDSPMGPVHCVRKLEPILAGKYVQLQARWEFGTEAPAKVYEELAVIGIGSEGFVSYWSFTSDGKKSQGVMADVTDLHPEAVGFEAEMPAGIARMVYWPGEEDGFVFAVESRTKKGWNRFVEHHYRPL